MRISFLRLFALLFAAAAAALPARAATLFQPGYELVAQSAPVFSRPHDVVLSPDGKYLLVADLGHDDVKIVDPMTLEILASLGQGELSAPHDVAFLNATTVLVADTSNDRIAVYDFRGVSGGKADAALAASWRHSVSNPEGVAVAPGGGLVYVTNVGGGSVLKMDTAGKVLGKAGGYGSTEIAFNRPHDVAVHPDGRVFVADSGNDRMVILDPDLKFIREMKGPPWNFDDPKYMAFDAAGELWLADEYNSRVFWLAKDQSIKAQVGSGKKGDGPGELNWPEGVEVSGDLIWISDTYNNRLLLLRRLP